MNLSNIKIGRKLALLSAVGMLQLACIAGLALWALGDSGAASDKAQHYAHKMDVVEKMNATQQQMALLAGDTVRVRSLGKDYTDSLEYLKSAATTDEDRGLLKKIEGVFIPWQSALLTPLRGSAGRRQRAESLRQLAELDSAVSDYLKYRQRRLDTFQTAQIATVASVRSWLIAGSLLAFVCSVILGRIISVSVTAPLSNILEIVGTVSKGDVTREVMPEYLSRRDEVGLLANAVRQMSLNLRQLIGSMTKGIAVLSASSSELSSSSGQMSGNSQGASDKAHTVAAAAEQMSANVASVASGMEQTTTNLSSVAAAAEQMTSTIGGIAANSEKARRITDGASRQATLIEEQMSRLGKAAQQIGRVVDSITEISAQTNLLALNATIEAARAGAAGKGFAVVASEIKNLAQQANTATEDIKARVAEVQSSATGGIAEIGKVSQVIHDVSDIVASIAAAIGQQSVATRGIAQNVAEATIGVREANRHVAEVSMVTGTISRDVADMDHATSEIAAGSVHVKTSAAELSAVAEQLQVTVKQFRV